MNNKIILSADSTCDLGEDLKKKYDVSYYPFHIILDSEQYMDGVDITPDEIYRAYWDKRILPKTAAIGVGEYIDYFKGWVEQGYDVIHINLGSALSSAHQNCCAAAAELGHVYPVDSCSLSTGLSLLIIEAAKRINDGLPAEVIQKDLCALTSRINASFVLNTLEFLHAGGRCSTIAAMGANFLKLKPCIEVSNNDGSMTVGKKYRGELDKVLVQYTRDKLSDLNNIDQEKIFLVHSGIDDKYIDLVSKEINSIANFKDIYISRASCTISSHCGPNTLGIIFMNK